MILKSNQTSLRHPYISDKRSENLSRSLEMQFLECAASAVSLIPCGISGVGDVRRYKVKHLLGSGLENRFYCESGIAAFKLKRIEANEIVKKIVSKYEKQITIDGGPWGYTFDELYDLKTLTPKKRHLDTYDQVKKELEYLFD